MALNYFEEICSVVAEQFKVMPSNLYYEGNWFEIVSLYIRYANNIALQNNQQALDKDKHKYPKQFYTRVSENINEDESINNLFNRLNEIKA